MTPFLAGFGASLLLSLALTPLAARAALVLGVVDRPDAGLKTHRRPTPYLGGASLFLSFFLSVTAVKYLYFHTLHGVIAIVTGGFIVFMLGLVDDLVDLSPSVKFFGQTVAAALLVICSIHIQFITVACF